MVEHITRFFPKLAHATFRVTSEGDHGYNCLAWAAGFTHQRWWPLENQDEAHWPEEAPREHTLQAFQSAFATLGYAPCDSEVVEADTEKIALFVDATGLPTHAARQLASGLWTSKLGKAEDIEHALRDLEGDNYGSVALIKKRPQPNRE